MNTLPLYDLDYSAEIRRAIAVIEAETPAGGIGERGLATFSEELDGYPGLDAAFDRAVQAAAWMLGAPEKLGNGPSSGRPDVADVPAVFVPSRALRYAWWCSGAVEASIVMLTHDADTLRSFELVMRVRKA